MPKRPDCSECRYQGTVPGSCHSSCRHPGTKKVMENLELQVQAQSKAAGKYRPMIAKGLSIRVKGDPNGIEQGWFNWPWNFDPIWLVECDGFKEK